MRRALFFPFPRSPQCRSRSRQQRPSFISNALKINVPKRCWQSACGINAATVFPEPRALIPPTDLFRNRQRAFFFFSSAHLRNRRTPLIAFSSLPTLRSCAEIFANEPSPFLERSKPSLSPPHGHIFRAPILRPSFFPAIPPKISGVHPALARALQKAHTFWDQPNLWRDPPPNRNPQQGQPLVNAIFPIHLRSATKKRRLALATQRPATCCPRFEGPGFHYSFALPSLTEQPGQEAWTSQVFRRIPSKSSIGTPSRQIQECNRNPRSQIDVPPGARNGTGASI